MKTILAILCFILLLLVEEAKSSFGPYYKKQSENSLRENLENFSIRQELYSQLSASNITRIGRVFYPIGYGADPSGVEDSSGAILKALEDAFAVQNGDELLHGISDLGGVVLDLQGGNYKITQPIRFPSGLGNLLIKEGTLRASDTFPGDRHLIELWSPNSINPVRKSTDDNDHDHEFANQIFQNGEKIFYEDITFRDILFDSSFRGGGIFIIDSARIRINNCFFLSFTTQGIIIKKGHETFISNCFLGQHSTVGGDKAEKYFSGTAIDLKSNDNAITDVAIFSAAIGVVLRGQANMVTGVHCYNKATGFGGIGILVKLAGISQTRIDNCYMDFTAIVMEDPVQVHVTNVFFLGDANIVLRSVNGQILGLNIVDNMFSGNPRNNVPIVRLDGVFTSVDQVVIERNNVIGLGLRSTAGKLVVDGINGTKWVADFSPVLVFPNRISHFQYSFYVPDDQGFFKLSSHAVTNISNNVVVVESEQVVNGRVCVSVDQQ